MPQLLHHWQIGPPRPAKARPYPYFPLPGHRNMAEVLAEEERIVAERWATVLSPVRKRKETNDGQRPSEF
jgi:hypothetical protein